MTGTFVNVLAVLAGSLTGGMLRRKMSDRMTECLFSAMGMAAVGLGLNAVIRNMGDSEYPVLFIVSLAAGGAAGTAADLEGRIRRLSGRRRGDGRLGEGVLTGSLLFCIGTLSILGPVQSALYQDDTYLFTNAMLDLVTSTVLASAYGPGICISGAVLLAWQGGIYAAASAAGGFITDSMMCELSITGGFLIAMSGLKILGVKDFRVADYLPALLVSSLGCLMMSRC